MKCPPEARGRPRQTSWSGEAWSSFQCHRSHGWEGWGANLRVMWELGDGYTESLKLVSLSFSVCLKVSMIKS